MELVVLVIHLILAVALVGVILLQQSEGGALGIGGGSGGGLFSARGAANLLTRTTAVLAALFLATSIALAILAKERSRGSSVLDQAPQSEAPASPASSPKAPPEKQPEPTVPEPN